MPVQKNKIEKSLTWNAFNWTAPIKSKNSLLIEARIILSYSFKILESNASDVLK